LTDYEGDDIALELFGPNDGPVPDFIEHVTELVLNLAPTESTTTAEYQMKEVLSDDYGERAYHFKITVVEPEEE